MEKSEFIRIANTLDGQAYAFQSLAYHIHDRVEVFNFGTPCYHNKILGLSLVIIRADSALHALELCILALGYSPIREAGPVRVVVFNSVEEKESFKAQFIDAYANAVLVLDANDGLHPATCYQMACQPRVIATVNLPSVHTVLLSLTIKNEMDLIIWQQKIKNISDRPWDDLKFIEDNPNPSTLQLTFNKRKHRDCFLNSFEKLQWIYTTPPSCKAIKRTTTLPFFRSKP